MSVQRRRQPGLASAGSLSATTAAAVAEAVRSETRKILMTPSGVTRYNRAAAIVGNALLTTYGHLELVPAMHFLTRYPVRSYVYDLTTEVSRGHRLNPDEMLALHSHGFRATISLCAESPDGDAPTIAAAGLDGEIETHHHPIPDMNPPSVPQMVGILDTLADLRSRSVRTYVACHAGRLRAGVVTAGIRTAMLGWDAADALTEARNFGNFVPMQRAFIEDFGWRLAERYEARQNGKPERHPELGPYPLLAPGSVRPTRAQLSVTLKSAARTRPGLVLEG